MPTPARPLLVALNPKATEWNRIAEALSASLEEPAGSSRIETVDFRWSPFAMLGYDVVIFHWPRDIQGPTNFPALLRGLARYVAIYAAKLFGRTRFVWVAHNVVPHETGLMGPAFMRAFVRSMDGVIHFSHFSQAVMHATYGRRAGQREVVTVHGHYRGYMVTPPTPAPPARAALRLGFVGLIRPYKNLERLIECVTAAEGQGIGLVVAGKRQDRKLAAQIAAQYGDALHVELDMREDLLPDADMEAAIDRSDAIILPYRNILNSGAAILALSRNRPVIAPAEGSLPELRDAVGREWVYLYEGELSPALIGDVEHWLRETSRGIEADLSAFGWDRVGADVRPFLRKVATS